MTGHGHRRRERAFFALCKRESARDRETPRVDLDELIIHHAAGIVHRATGFDATAVRHRTRLDLCDFRQRRCIHDADAARYHLAVQIEIRRERVQPVRRHIERCREFTEGNAGADERIRAERILPQFAIGRAVACRHVQVFAVGRDLQAVRSLHLGSEFAYGNRLLNNCSARPEAHAMHLVGRLGANVNPVGGRRWSDSRGRGRCGGTGWTRRGPLRVCVHGKHRQQCEAELHVARSAPIQLAGVMDVGHDDRSLHCGALARKRR